MSLILDGQILATEHSTGILHVESDESSLKLYVPKDEKERMISYFAWIPERLAAHFSTNGADAVKVISDILKIDFDYLDDYLIELGIPELSGFRQIAEHDLVEANLYSDGETPDQVETNARRLSRSLTPTAPAVSSYTASASSSFIAAPRSSRVTTPEARNISLATERRLFSPERSLRETVEIVAQLDDYIAHYIQLLDNVINSGEEGDLPTNFGFTSSRRTNPATIAMDPDKVFGIRSQDVMAHDMRIGAAGELYVR